MRNIANSLKKDLGKKLVLLSGPRQVGKTTLARGLFTDCTYLNYDSLDDRRLLLKQAWDKNLPLVLDELHKHPKWKLWLKGLYDTQRLPAQILVTGSAKLDTFRRAGDSLAGRFFHHTLFPIDVKEGLQMLPGTAPKDVLDRLMAVGGFPEPFLQGSESEYRRWRASHLDVILRQDILEASHLRDIRRMENLFLLLTEKVGGLLSYQSLTEDLSADDKTIRSWIEVLESAYLVFRVPPLGSSQTSIKKMPKLYFLDLPRVENEAARFENCVALSLLKQIAHLNESEGRALSLRFLRNKAKEEIDFAILDGKKVTYLIEVKLNDPAPSPNFKTFAKQYPQARKVQLVRYLDKPFQETTGIHILPADQFLAELPI